MNLKHHKTLTKEKWSRFPFYKQIIMIANEINRAKNWIIKGDIDEVKNCYEKALELIDLTVAVLVNKKVLRESPSDRQTHEDFAPRAFEGKLKIGRYILNKFHLEGMKMVYDRINKQGKMRINFSDLLQQLSRGEFDDYEKEIKDYFDLMTSRKFFPNTPALINFGSHLGMGSACFVLPIEDSIEEIMDTLRQSAIIFKSEIGRASCRERV